jgi:DNA-binding transcriptional regulator YhcF (GntR family)
MEFKESQAIYLQIADYLCEQILLGRFPEDDRLPSVRDLGIRLEVNPNTVIRAYDFLQTKEIVYNRRGLGYFVAVGARDRILAHRRKQFTEQDLPWIFKTIALLGLKWDEIGEAYDNYLKQPNNPPQAHESK